MRTIFILFDSLNRKALEPYGNTWVKTPNFTRLAKKSETFDRCYAASLPCMPARRDLHTGRLSFLHRSWGPLEPFDQSVITEIKNHGIYTHLISDHTHYWEEGGANYHTKYDTWEIVRGQEGDKWIPSLEPVDTVGMMGRVDEARVQDVKNRVVLKEQNRYPIESVFQQAEEFLCKNANQDNWFLQIESFDPHEPFFSKEKFRELYPHTYNGEEFDWPDYKKVSESKDAVSHCKMEYAALVSACDYHLGKVMDLMDQHEMWEDTMLIITTDHGYLLGEHGWWAKTVQPIFDEVGHTPLFVWNPKLKRKDVRNSDLVQMIDMAPTLMDFYGISIGDSVTGISLMETDRNKEGCLFGIHGCYLNITDGRYVYMRRPRKSDGLFQYTLMPCHMKTTFSLEELEAAVLAEPSPYTKGYPTLKIPAKPWAGINFDEYGDLLFDLWKDKEQKYPLNEPEIECRLLELARGEMTKNNAPSECYEYWGMESN